MEMETEMEMEMEKQKKKYMEMEMEMKMEKEKEEKKEKQNQTCSLLSNTDFLVFALTARSCVGSIAGFVGYTMGSMANNREKGDAECHVRNCEQKKKKEKKME